NSEVNSLRGRRGDWLVVMCSSFRSSGSAVYSNHDTPILGRDSQAPTLSLVPEPLIRSLGDRPFGILFCDRHGEFPQIAVGIETLENTIPVGLVVGLRRNLASMRLAVLVYRY